MQLDIVYLPRNHLDVPLYKILMEKMLYDVIEKYKIDIFPKKVQAINNSHHVIIVPSHKLTIGKFT